MINDVIKALTDSVQPDGYIKDMRRRDEELSKGWRQIAAPLKIPTKGGLQKINCANAEGIFRIVQSIPSPKAEPFKRWLARVGYERVKEIEDPELATKRTRMLYKAKGYTNAWIEKRMRGIEIRETLTDEWDKKGNKKFTRSEFYCFFLEKIIVKANKKLSVLQKIAAAMELMQINSLPVKDFKKLLKKLNTSWEKIKIESLIKNSLFKFYQEENKPNGEHIGLMLV